MTSLPASVTSVPNVTSVSDPRPISTALLTTAQAAKYLALGQRTLENWRCRGVGPAFVRLGRVVRYRVSDLNAWLSVRTFASTSQADHAA